MNFTKLLVLIPIIAALIYLSGGIGYYNWDTILYTSKISNYDLPGFVSFGRPFLYLLGFIIVYPVQFNSNETIHLLLSLQTLLASLVFLWIFSLFLKINNIFNSVILVLLAFSLPTFFTISTSFLPEVFMLLFSFALFYSYVKYIHNDKENKYLYYQLILLFLLAGIREYFLVTVAIIILHLLWTKKIFWRYFLVLSAAVIIIFLIYYLLLPHIFNVKYFKVRLPHISNFHLSEVSTFDRLEEIWDSIKYNFNILLLIPGLLLYIYQKKKRGIYDLDKLFIIFFFTSFVLLLLYGDIYTYRRYTAILVIPVIYFLFEAFAGLHSKIMRLVFVTGILLNFMYTLSSIGTIINLKNEIKVFINDVDYLISNNNNEVVFYSDFRSLEYALLEYHFNAVLKNEIIIQQQDELNTDLIRNSKKKFLISSQPEYFLINKIKFRKYSNRIYEVIE